MSTALYRRYRPETFAEVIGQEHVTVPLCAALTKNRVNHAYLFSGPRGCGKTTSARILARCLNCVQGPTPTPCGECPSCIDLARGGPGSLDVVEIDAASHGGVDDARSLRERAVFAPARDRYKVFIIDEAHMVSTQGFNALLKIVEEPPPHVRFVFATTEPEKVIGTIRSRTHHYPFRLVPPERLQAYLGELCEAEDVPVGQGVLPLVVRAGAGSVRDSLSVLDQLIAGAGEDGLSYALAISLLGYTDATLLDEVVDGLAAGDGRAVFGILDRVISSGHDPRRFVEDLLERLRDLLVVAAVPDGGHGVLRGLPADQLERMKGQAARFGRAELSRAADVVNTALTEMTGATSPRLQLELLAARLLLPGSEDTERGLRARVDRIEKRIGVADLGAPHSPPAAPVAPATAPAAPAPVAPVSRPPAASPAPAAAVAPAPSPRQGAGGGVETVRRMWPDVLDKLRGMRRMTWTLVSEYAQVLDLDGDRLMLVFDSPGRAASFGRGSHAEYLRQSLIDVIGLDVQVEAVSGDPARARAQARPPAGQSGPNQGGAGHASHQPPSHQPPSHQPPSHQPPSHQPPSRPGFAPPQARAVSPPPPPRPATLERPPLAEPPGWGPRPTGSAVTTLSPDQERRAAPGGGRAAPGFGAAPAVGPARPGSRPPGVRPAPGGDRGPSGSGRRLSAAPPDNDIPLPPEPPADEPPPEDDFDPYARPPGPLSSRRPEPLLADRPRSAQGHRPSDAASSASATAERSAGQDGARAAHGSAEAVPTAAVSTSRYAAMRAADSSPVPGGGSIVLPEDEPSADDPTIEESGMVGSSVVAQLLGGRVIEERNE